MADKSYFRGSEVAISSATKWALTRIVKARNESKEELTVPASVDALAEQILSVWIAHNHPDLPALWHRRESIDADAEASVTKGKQ